MAQPSLVSVIIPAYNRQHTLRNTIQSIINQTYTHWELMIVDDGSTEDIREVVNEYAFHDPRIKYLSNGGNKGPAAARNNGIRNSHGEYLAFLDSDDEWFSHHLADSLKALLEEKVKVCFALWWEKSSMGQITKLLDADWEKERLSEAIQALNPGIHGERIIFPAPGFFEFNAVKTVYCCHINSLVLHRDVIQKTGLFNEELAASEDLNFMDRILHQYPFCLIKKYHFIYHQGEDNIHNFIDRKNVDIEAVLGNRRIVNKLTFCGIYKCTALKLRKKYIRQSPGIKEKSNCIQRCNADIGIKYFTLSYLNQKINKIKAMVFLGQSLMYKYNFKTIKLSLNIIFPGIIKNPNITPDDLWLH